MSHEPGADRTVSVSDDDVRVEKSFARDEFPVPAITFRLTSESNEPVHVRLVDRIPEDFPMEGIGFHPDYESDSWTAYKDHRVEYERTVEPGESVTTVYGIRLEEASDVAGFLREPILERPPVPGEAPEERTGTDVDDVLGTDRSQLVRDALQGRGRLAEQTPPEARDPEETQPAPDEPAVEARAVDDGPEAGAKPEEAAEVDPAAEEADDGPDGASGAPDAVDAANTPRAVDSGLTAVVRRNDEAVTPVTTEDADPDHADETASGDDSEPEPEPAADAAAESDADADEYVDIGERAGVEAEPSAGDPVDATAADAATDGGLAAALAAEIRSGEVSETDLETLRGELDGGLPRSADVRIRRLQSQLADLDAYADAIKEFIDEEGTGAELVERLGAELDEVSAELESLREGLDTAGEERAALSDDVDDLSTDLAATDERLDNVDETAATAVAGVEELHERADGVAARLDDVEFDLDDLADDIDDVDMAIEDIEADVDDVATGLDETDTHVSELDDEVAAVREDVAAVDADVEGVREELEAKIDELRGEISTLSEELDRVESIEDEIEQLQAFRDRLNSAFGPAGGAGGGGGDADSSNGAE